MQHSARGMRRCGVRDQRDDSFVRLVTAEHAGLLRYATALAGDPDQAADIVQDVLTRAYQRWATIAQADRPGAYLMTMVTNEFLSWRRRWNTRLVTVTADDALARAAPATGDHGEGITVRDDLERRLSRLPRRQQAALVLRYYEGLDHDEVAEILGCATGTVRSLCSRGLATLRIEESEPLTAPAPASAPSRRPARLPTTRTDSP